MAAKTHYIDRTELGSLQLLYTVARDYVFTEDVVFLFDNWDSAEEAFTHSGVTLRYWS